MAILKRPMFRKGGSANEGIMHGLERRGYDKGSEKDEYKSEDFWNSIVGRTLRIPGDYIAKPVYNVATQSLVNPLFGTELEQLETPYDAADAWLWNKMGKGYHPIYNPDGDPKTDDFVDKKDWGYENLRFKKAEGPKELEDPIEMIKGPPGGTQLPYVPKKRIETGNQLEKIIAKKESLSDRNKRYMDMMAPHMQKRMVADALGAASESFEKSTGNTKQDIARALGAAGRAMSDTRDIADKVSMLTLQGEIQKDIGTSIEAAKEKQLGNYQFLAKLSKEDPTTFNKITKSGSSVTDMAMEFSKQYQTKGAERGLGDAYQLKANAANAKTYGGTLDLTEDGKTADFEKMEKGKIYYNYLDLNFYAIGDDGTPKQVAKPDYLK